MVDDRAPEGALVVSRPLCECHGAPCFTNGISHGKRRWRCSVRTLERNRVFYAKNVESISAKATTWNKNNPDRRSEISRKNKRKSLGWFDAEGMATKPTQFKELT